MEKTDLIDRYLQAVKFWLPKNQKRDIIQELSEDLHSQVEEREAVLGCELNEDEVAGLLRRRGYPLVVASRFLPQQYLIGPVLFPFYAFILKLVAVCYFVPWVLVWTGMMVFDASFRARHLGFGIVQDWAFLWKLSWLVFTFITFLFAVLERLYAKGKLFEKWNPRDLPAVPRLPRRPSFRTQNLIDLFFNANFVVWWLAIGYYPHTFFGFATDVFRPAAGLGAYYWPLFALAVVNLAQQITNAFRPEWIWLRPATQAATSGAMAILLGLMLKIKPLVVLQDSYAHVDRYVTAVDPVNLVAFWALIGIAVGLGIACCAYTYQLVRLYRRQGRPGATVAVQSL